jgi:glutamate synthase domain-containing protein 2
MTEWILAGIGGFLILWILYDITQKKHAVMRNFPIVGHFRYWLETIGPELRQYIVTNNDEERPFSRDQRRWIYTSSKHANNYFGFGSDNDFDAARNYILIRHAAFPLDEPVPDSPNFDPEFRLPAAKVMGGARQRKRAFRPESILNISAMSFGALSSKAVEAINRGAKLAGCMQNTGEGAISPYHKKGGDLIWQIGTGYFGCRTPEGRFSMEQLQQNVAENPVRALEIKLSQGAKPSKGGILPAAKITREIAAIRGVPMDRDCVSPPGHSTFHDVDGMLDFVESLAGATGLPVGIKSAVGEMGFWEDLARLMDTTGRGVDFITIDGGEGGTGAAPLSYSDHVSLPFKMGMSQSYRIFAERGLTERIVFIGSGRLGFPVECLAAFALGCDMINVAREAMLAIGCIQAQRCHTGHCPSGVATQNPWLKRGLDPRTKAVRLANYITVLRKEILQLSRSCGMPHPALIPGSHVELMGEIYQSRPVKEVFGYREEWGHPSPADQEAIRAIMAALPGPPPDLAAHGDGGEPPARTPGSKAATGD